MHGQQNVKIWKGNQRALFVTRAAN